MLPHFESQGYMVEEQVAEAEKVVTRFAVACTTHDRREFRSVAPTGVQRRPTKPSSSTAIEGGKITEGRGAWERTSQE